MFAVEHMRNKRSCLVLLYLVFVSFNIFLHNTFLFISINYLSVQIIFWEFGHEMCIN